MFEIEREVSVVFRDGLASGEDDPASLKEPPLPLPLAGVDVLDVAVCSGTYPSLSAVRVAHSTLCSFRTTVRTHARRACVLCEKIRVCVFVCVCLSVCVSVCVCVCEREI